MAQSFADSFGWIQKSENLRSTLDRAYAYARNMSHKMVMLEHLLLALTEDYDAQLVFQACKIDPIRLRGEVTHLMETQFGQLVEPNAVPLVSEALQKVLTHAAAACEQSRRSQIDGAIVLAALIGEGNSPAAEILKFQGITFDEAINNLGRTNGAPQPQGDAAYCQNSGYGSSPSRNLAENYAHQLDSSVEDILNNVRNIIGVEPSEGSVRESGTSLQSVPANTYSESRTSEPWNDGYQSQGNSANLHGNGIVHGSKFSGVQDEYRDSNFGIAYQTDHPYAVNQQNPGSGYAQTALKENPAIHDYHSPLSEYDSIVQTGQLIETIPRRMRNFVKESIEVRIVRASAAELENNIMGSAVSSHAASSVTEAMTVQLRAPQGGFQIENLSPETQWIESNLGFSDEYANWRWTVTPTRRGKQRLDLIISTRQVGFQGVVAENALPEQIFEIKVRSNYLRSLARVLGWSVAAIVGGGIAVYGRTAYQMIIQLI